MAHILKSGGLPVGDDQIALRLEGCEVIDYTGVKEVRLVEAGLVHNDFNALLD
jgi:hypothetical protein